MAQSNTAQKRLLVSENSTASESDPETKIATSSQSTTHFAYSRLLPDEIRLFKLLPTVSFHDDLFMGELIHVKISERPLYAAVSYTWNSSAAQTQILIGATPLMIHQNVHKILKHLRKESYPRLLWVDSICINQSDISERNSQVRLMGDIFAGASYVVAWLDTAGPRNALDAVAQIFKSSSSISIWESRLECSAWFFEHRYWTRRWIVQEILLARSVILASNTTEIPLLRVVESLKSLSDKGKYSDSDKTTLRRQAERSPFLRLFPFEAPQSRETRLADLIYVHRYAKCAELTDRIYALASLSPNTRLYLKVDYSIDSSSLLNHVLDFCVDREGLDEDGLIWLLLLLKRQLGITDEKLKILLDKRASTRGLWIGRKEMKTVVIRRRGIISGPGLSHSKVEQYILDSRAIVPPLGRIDQSSWLPLKYPKFSMSPEDLQKTIKPTEELSGHDLFGFVFRDLAREKKSKKKRPLRLGFSSAWLEPDDQVWQFRRTPTALIVRKHKDDFGNGFSIIGKAYILKYRELTGFDDETPSKMLLDELLSYHEEAMDWKDYSLQYIRTSVPKDSSNEGNKETSSETDSLATKFIHLSLNVPVLLKLLKWIDFDH